MSGDIGASLWLLLGAVTLLLYVMATRRFPSLWAWFGALLLGPFFLLFTIGAWLFRGGQSDEISDEEIERLAAEGRKILERQEAERKRDVLTEYEVLLGEVEESLDRADDSSSPPKKGDIARLQTLGNIARKDAVKDVLDVEQVIDLLERGLEWVDLVYSSDPELAERRGEAISSSIGKLRKRLGKTSLGVEDDSDEDIVIGSLSGRVFDKSPVWRALDAGDYHLLTDMELTSPLVNETRTAPGFPRISPLMIVAQKGGLEEVKTLVEAGADVNARCGGNENYSPLLFAVNGMADPDLVLYLLDAGADVNAIQRGDASFSPLALAVCKGQRVVADLLLAHGADPFWKNAQGMNIIKMAVTNNIGTLSEPTLNKLVELGVPVHEADQEGFFAIHNAGSSCNAVMVRFLAEHGADVNQPVLGDGDDAGSRPLELAAAEGNAQAFFALLELGAKVEFCLKKDAPFEPESPETILEREGQYDILTRTLFRAAGRSHCVELEDDVARIVKVLVLEHGARPTLLTLAIALAFEYADETRRLLFAAARDDLVPAIEAGNVERTLQPLSLLCCAMMYASAGEIDQDYLVRLEKEVLSLLGKASKPVKAQVRSVIASLG